VTRNVSITARVSVHSMRRQWRHHRVIITVTVSRGGQVTAVKHTWPVTMIYLSSTHLYRLLLRVMMPAAMLVVQLKRVSTVSALQLNSSPPHLAASVSQVSQFHVNIPADASYQGAFRRNCYSASDSAHSYSCLSFVAFVHSDLTVRQTSRPFYTLC